MVDDSSSTSIVITMLISELDGSYRVTLLESGVTISRHRMAENVGKVFFVEHDKYSSIIEITSPTEYILHRTIKHRDIDKYLNLKCL